MFDVVFLKFISPSELTLSTVVFLKSRDEGFPSRPRDIADHTPLISAFEPYPRMYPFVRFLFNEHGIYNVGQWDKASTALLDAFDLDDEQKALFKKKIGRPESVARPDDRRVISFVAARAPI